MDEPSERWLSVAAAVQETGVPERSLYRWIKAKRLPTRASDGATMVEASAVRALAATRKAAGGAAIAGRAAGGSGGSDPEIDSMILARLDQGDRPLDLVRDLRVAPQRVRLLVEELGKLKALERGPPVADQLAGLQAGQTDHASKIRALLEAVGDLASMLEDLKRRLTSLPFPPSRDAYSCACGARGLYAVPTRCTSCGREQFLGFQAPRPA